MSERNPKQETDMNSIPTQSEMETIVSKAIQKTNEFSFESTENKLKEIFDQLALIKNYLENKVRSNENSYSHWKSIFDNEIKELENNYYELRGSETSLKQVKRQLDFIRKDAEEMKTHCEHSKPETNRLEMKVEKYEPKLFSVYRKLLETPLEEEKANLREELQKLIRKKQTALDVINDLIKSEETGGNNERKDGESWDDDLSTQSAICPHPASSPPQRPPIPQPPPLPPTLPWRFATPHPYEPSYPHSSRVGMQQMQFVNDTYGNYFNYNESIGSERDGEPDIELELRPIN